jgi:hypothetical protein
LVAQGAAHGKRLRNAKRAGFLPNQPKRRLLRRPAELSHPTEVELRKAEMGHRRFRRSGRAGAVQLLEGAVDMVGDPVLDRHPRKNLRLGVGRDRQSGRMAESPAPRNQLDQARNRSSLGGS